MRILRPTILLTLHALIPPLTAPCNRELRLLKARVVASIATGIRIESLVLSHSPHAESLASLAGTGRLLTAGPLVDNRNA